MLTEKKNNQKSQFSKKLTDHTPESQFHMDQPGPSRAQESKLQKDQPGPSGSQRTQPPKAPKQPRRKGTAPTKRAHKPNKELGHTLKGGSPRTNEIGKSETTPKEESKITTYPTGHEKTAARQISENHQSSIRLITRKPATNSYIQQP